MDKENKKMEENTAKKLNTEEKEEKEYTYADLLEMDDENRYEIIDGKLYLMSSPTLMHQAIAGEIYAQLRDFLKGKKCRPFIAPSDVALSKFRENNKIKNIVQPDVFIICDSNQVEEEKIFGAPSFVLEVLSPSTSRKDKLVKMNLYQKYGVKEYWLLDPNDMTVTAYILNEKGIYETEKMYYDLETEEVPVRILKGCKINLIEFIKEYATWKGQVNTKTIPDEEN